MISSKIKAAFVGMAAFAALGVGVAQAISADDAVEPASVPMSSCLDASRLTTRMVVDSDTLFIEDMNGKGAVLEMTAPCSQMRDLDQISFEFSGSTRVCGRTDIKVVHNTPNGAIPARCIVKTYTPMTRDETRAYLASVIEK